MTVTTHMKRTQMYFRSSLLFTYTRRSSRAGTREEPLKNDCVGDSPPEKHFSGSEKWRPEIHLCSQATTWTAEDSNTNFAICFDLILCSFVTYCSFQACLVIFELPHLEIATNYFPITYEWILKKLIEITKQDNCLITGKETF